jgi:hypothetical protein
MFINIIVFIPQLSNNYLFFFPLLVAIFVLYIANRFYFLIYKTLPLEIVLDKSQIICTNFIFNKARKEIINIKDIKSISGGIFEGRLNGIIKITDVNNVSIAFSHRISDSTKLIAGILEKVDKKIYEEAINNLTKLTNTLTKRSSQKREN